MAKKNVLTLKDILNRKEYLKNKNKETRELLVERLDANIVISKADVDLCSDCSEMDSEYESNKYFVYEIVQEPNLKDSQLQDEFGVEDPVDIVEEIFEPGEIVDIAKAGMKFAGFGTIQVVEELKN